MSAAKFEKSGVSSSISDVVVGDNLVIQGTVNGSSVVASSVIDSGSGTNTTTSTSNQANHSGLFNQVGGAISSFFHKLFGFF